MSYRVLLPLIFLFSNVFAADQSVENVSKMISSIVNVVLNQEDSIAGLCDDRLYLKSENIFHSKNGYILRNTYSTIALPKLSFDENGEGYLLCRSPEDFQLLCSNPECGLVFWFSDTGDGSCPRCGSMGN